MKRIIELPRLQKQLLAAVTDLVFLPFAFYLAISLRFDGVSLAMLHQYFGLILAAPVVSIPIFIKLGLYRAVVRFIDHKIVYVVMVGVTLSVIFLAALAAMTHVSGLSRGVFGIYWVCAIMYVVVSRFASFGSGHASDGTVSTARSAADACGHTETVVNDGRAKNP